MHVDLEPQGQRVDGIDVEAPRVREIGRHRVAGAEGAAPAAVFVLHQTIGADDVQRQRGVGLRLKLGRRIVAQGDGGLIAPAEALDAVEIKVDAFRGARVICRDVVVLAVESLVAEALGAVTADAGVGEAELRALALPVLRAAQVEAVRGQACRSSTGRPGNPCARA